MKKLVLAISFLFLFVMSAKAEYSDARKVTSLTTTADTTSITVVGGASVYTSAFKTEHIVGGDDINFFIKATSATGTPNVSYYFEESYAEPTVPANGTGDTAWLITDNLVASQTTENWILATADTVSGTWGRVYIKGAATNPTDTTISIKMVK